MVPNICGNFAAAQYPCYWLGADGEFWMNEAANQLSLASQTAERVKKMLQEAQQAKRDAALHPLPAEALQAYGLAVLPQPEGVLAVAVPTQGLAVSTVSAQVRQPINDIFASLLSLGRRVDETELPQLERMQNNCYKLLRLSHNLESINKAIQGAFSRHSIDFAALVQALCDDTRSVCAQNNIPIEADLPDTPVYVQAEMGLLSEAILNILRNSIQFTREENRIRVKLYAAAGRAVLTVEDKGLGIKPQYLEDIFEPYFSQDPYGDSAEGPGAGLGLAVARQVAHSLGGTLLAESTFGEGSRFVLSLPLCAQSENALQSSPTDYLLGRYSPVFVQLCGYCRYPDL